MLHAGVVETECVLVEVAGLGESRPLVEGVRNERIGEMDLVRLPLQDPVRILAQHVPREHSSEEDPRSPRVLAPTDRNRRLPTCLDLLADRDELRPCRRRLQMELREDRLVVVDERNYLRAVGNVVLLPSELPGVWEQDVPARLLSRSPGVEQPLARVVLKRDRLQDIRELT